MQVSGSRANPATDDTKFNKIPSNAACALSPFFYRQDQVINKPDSKLSASLTSGFVSGRDGGEERHGETR